MATLPPVPSPVPSPDPSPALDRRIPLIARPTPLEPLPRLGAALGLAPGTLWVKRDDLTGLAGGGNKARKLEFLCAAALAEGCDVLVTGGAAQSNHVRMTAAAANRLGLGCVGVLRGDPASPLEGNLILDRVLGARLVWTGTGDINGAIEETCAALRAAGQRPYAIPAGGASPIGTLGYVDAARELRPHLADGDLVVVAAASGGTLAGLAVGLGRCDLLLGVDCGASPALEADVARLAGEVAALAGLPAPVGRVLADHEQVGAGYGEPTEAAREALQLAARLEGLLLDPAYTAKAMAALIARARRGDLAGRRRVVFLHTGGLPELFVGQYAAWATA